MTTADRVKVRFVTALPSSLPPSEPSLPLVDTPIFPINREANFQLFSGESAASTMMGKLLRGAHHRSQINYAALSRSLAQGREGLGLGEDNRDKVGRDCAVAGRVAFQLVYDRTSFGRNISVKVAE